MTELPIGGGQARPASRNGRRGRLRWYLLLLGVTILCGATYLLGIWVGMRTHVTCTSTSPGQIVCGTGDVPAPPQPSKPATPPQEQGSA